MNKTAAQLDAEIAAYLAGIDREISATISDIEANKRHVLGAAQGLAKSCQRLAREIEKKRNRLEAELDKLEDGDPRRREVERALARLENASVPDGADVVRGIRDVLDDDAKVRI